MTAGVLLPTVLQWRGSLTFLTSAVGFWCYSSKLADDIPMKRLFSWLPVYSHPYEKIILTLNKYLLLSSFFKKKHFFLINILSVQNRNQGTIRKCSICQKIQTKGAKVKKVPIVYRPPPLGKFLLYLRTECSLNF